MERHSIGKNLVYQRTLKGFTQEKLAEKSKVTKRTIQRIEKDDVNPQLQTVQLLANALNIEVDDLLQIENSKKEALQKKWLLFIHGSPLIGFIFPFSVLLPLFIWLHKRDDNLVYSSHGIRVINFQLTITILYAFAFVSLLTIKGWGFLFFIIVIAFNILVTVFNVFKAVTSQECLYPSSIPFLRIITRTKSLSILFLSTTLLLGCSSSNEKNQLKILQEYEGKYEYFNGQEIQMVVSELDTTLYAILDNTKYPMTYVEKNRFKDVQNNIVIFHREKSIINGYRVEGQDFKLISKDFNKMEMLPRRNLFGNPESYIYNKPTTENDGIETGNLKEAFTNPHLIIDMVKEIIKGTYPDVHSILLYKNNKLVLEEYFYGYNKNTPHQIRSAIKPIIGGVVGIAIDKGYIKSEKELLLPFFTNIYDSIAYVDEYKKQITIENFLMYQHGMDCQNNNTESIGNEMAMRQSKDWVKYTLDLPMVMEPGITSSYCTGCALTLGRLVEIATGEEIEAFAKANLFETMGISNYGWIFEPNLKGQANFRLTKMTPRDLLKIAKMYKDNGKWQGQQILSEDWVYKTFDMEQGDYGYLWEHKYFMIDGKQYNSYMASGNGGQKINIWPELDLITIFTGGNYNSYQLYGKSTPPNEMIPKYILKAL
jgi:transcriptional regulator with XRE-family HTH domain